MNIYGSYIFIIIRLGICSTFRYVYHCFLHAQSYCYMALLVIDSLSTVISFQFTTTLFFLFCFLGTFVPDQYSDGCILIFLLLIQLLLFLLLLYG